MTLIAAWLLVLMACGCAADKATERRPPHPAERFQSAARAGDPDAQFDLGVIYSNGEGGSEDFAEAAANYRRAAEHGHAAAAGALAFMYFSGHGVEKNPAEAVKWLEAAESRAAPEDRWMYLLWREYVSSAISRR